MLNKTTLHKENKYQIVCLLSRIYANEFIVRMAKSQGIAVAWWGVVSDARSVQKVQTNRAGYDKRYLRLCIPGHMLNKTTLHKENKYQIVCLLSWIYANEFIVRMANSTSCSFCPLVTTPAPLLAIFPVYDIDNGPSECVQFEIFYMRCHYIRKTSTKLYDFLVNHDLELLL